MPEGRVQRGGDRDLDRRRHELSPWISPPADGRSGMNGADQRHQPVGANSIKPHHPARRPRRRLMPRIGRAYIQPPDGGLRAQGLQADDPSEGRRSVVKVSSKRSFAFQHGLWHRSAGGAVTRPVSPAVIRTRSFVWHSAPAPGGFSVPYPAPARSDQSLQVGPSACRGRPAGVLEFGWGHQAVWPVRDTPPL